MADPATLYFFDDQDDLTRFSVNAVKTFTAMLAVAQMATVAQGDWRQAILLNRLVNRMMHYKESRAAELSAGQLGETIADVDRELDALWPLFQGIIDDELTEAQEMLDLLHSALKERAN